MKKKNPTSFRLESYGLSDIGLIRPNNEDAFLSMPRYRFFAIADGMGGHNAGEVASKEAVTHLSTSIKTLIHPQKKANIPTKDLIYHLRSAIDDTNSKIFNLGNATSAFRGMGTTLSCLYLYEDSVIYAHIGDSRIYRFRENELKQLTQDHSVLTESKSQKGAYKYVITRAIGTCFRVEPEIAAVTVQPGDIFVMCTDGLSDYVSSEEIEALLKRKSSLQKKAKDLIHSAKSEGSSDNITALLVKVQR